MLKQKIDRHFIDLDWQEPLNFAQKISDNYAADWIFLYSALNEKTKKSTSTIALFGEEKIICEEFDKAEKIIKNSRQKWFGYLSYELGQDFEKLPKTAKSFIDLPKIFLINFSLILEFDHDKKKLRAQFSDEKILSQVLAWRQKAAQKNSDKKSEIKNLNSNFTNKSYLAAIRTIQKMIALGDFYQTNLTRKFFGEFSEKQNHHQVFKMFADLTKLSPANYCAFMNFAGNFIISSSPELFLKAKNRTILSRPIKGTAPRHDDLEIDKKNKSHLKNSIKERAENLMIVDLVRNDLSRICKAGSVAVKKLFAITSYKNIHHMSSEISGKIADNFCAFDGIQACFPPGSMTGAPKIKAMAIAAKKEKMNRGIYSGAIGIFAKNEVNSSVVIRTLILRDAKFEFQVGGAITFDSNPEGELAEIFTKAKSIAGLLSISLED